MSTVTFNKELIVAEDLLTGVGAVTQNRGVGSKINASNLAYDATTSLKTVIDSKDSTVDVDAKLALKADLDGNPAQVFEVATATTNTQATTKGQMDTALTLKGDKSYVDSQDALKADKTNVLQLDNTTPFTPTSTYQPATKKYVDDSIFNTGAADMRKAVYDVTDSGIVDTTEGVGIPATFLGISSQDQILRLAQTAITDCNTISKFGIFIGTDVANAPVNGMIGLEQLEIPSGKAQRCFSLTTRDSYNRTYDNVSWSLWNKILDQGDIINSLAGSLDTYAVLHAQQGKVLNDKITLKADQSTTYTKTEVDTSTTLVHKDSSTGAAYIPSGTTAQRPVTPSSGYMRFNTTLLSAEVWNGTMWTPVGGGATGGGADTVFVETSYNVTTNYTLTAGKSAMTVGDANGNVTIQDGVTISIPDNSSWVIQGA